MCAAPARRYSSPQREAQANATRRRILGAAEELFAEHGFAAVTMPRIAEHAGLSLATVYLYFRTKANIVGAMADEIVAAPDLSVEQVEREHDPVRMMRRGAGIIRRLNERSWLVADILRGAHGTDEHLARVWAEWQRRHLDASRRAVEALRARGGLRPGLAPDEAVDVLYALAGTDVYRALVRERRWSPARYQEWLFRLGCRELIGA
ncbi:MAG TPA: TetR/AcrR family transcriptional regulator [Chloroflexota bacterium]|nr:TetR/AcrR family transcriptional regulator [Chloroflexota bacterium]